MIKKNKIEFTGKLRGKTLSELATAEPINLASKFVPKWRKEQKKTFNNNGVEKLTSKYCPGIHDFSRAGYIVPMWHDVKLRYNKETDHKYEIHSPQIVNKIFFDHELETAQGNGMGDNDYYVQHEYGQVENAPFLEGSCKSIIKLKSPWSLSVPKGVSFIHCHPFYHVGQEEYTIVSGIVDADMDKISNREINVFIKLNKPDSIITIKKGQPLVQVIPFIRSEYELSVDTQDVHEVEMLRHEAQSTFDSVVHADINRSAIDEEKWSPIKSHMIKKNWGCPVEHK